MSETILAQIIQWRRDPVLERQAKKRGHRLKAFIATPPHVTLRVQRDSLGITGTIETDQVRPMKELVAHNSWTAAERFMRRRKRKKRPTPER
jgi:hypothetical protein